MDYTPDGRGDCVVDLDANNQVLGKVESGSDGSGGGSGMVFVKPEERRLTFQAFAEGLLAFNDREGDPEPHGAGFGVPYLSHQVGVPRLKRDQRQALLSGCIVQEFEACSITTLDGRYCIVFLYMCVCCVPPVHSCFFRTLVPQCTPNGVHKT